MLYRKNLPDWERWLRTLAGLALLTYGVLGATTWLVTGLATLAALGLVGTAFVGYCPACALVGRAPRPSRHDPSTTL